MSDKTNDDMVTWLRREHTNDLSPLGRDYTDEEIAAALEAAEKRAAEYAAVVEKVRVFIERQSGWFRYRAEPVSTILATEPTDALREHDAKVRAEALREAAEEADEWKVGDGMHGGEWFPSEWAGQVAGWLEHRAARIRE